jgi:hypothetical protein
MAMVPSRCSSTARHWASAAIFPASSHARDHEFCEETWLWIDQISLDQSNISERNHQVGQMGDIFHGAEEVMIWLGEGEFWMDHAMDTIDQNVVLPDEISGKGTRESTNFTFQRLFELSDHGYWKRLWVIQEIVLAMTIVLVCGKYRIPWKKLIIFLDANP